MRALPISFALLMEVLLGGCDKRFASAQQIVRRELREPSRVDFRRLQAKGAEPVVCGEVDASDRPGGGWRYFVAYTDLGRAAIAPPGGVTSDGERGNQLLAGEADRFNHTCD